MNRAYPCIGGPIDGQTRPSSGGLELYVAELQKLIQPYKPNDSVPVSAQAALHRYTLCTVPGVGLAWVHQP